VSLNILHLYNFPIYSVVVVSHAHVIECAPMLGFTTIDLSFLKNLRSIWVVVIGLELLSLACPSLDLGSDHVTSFYTCVTLSVLWLFDSISVENQIWGDRIGTCSVWCWQLKALSGAMLEAYGLLSYPNLRIGSWSDHPWKHYNHKLIWVWPDIVCGRV
jgi:hypothetical protein